MSIKTRIQKIEQRRRSRTGQDPAERFRELTSHLPEQIPDMWQWSIWAKRGQEARRDE